MSPSCSKLRTEAARVRASAAARHGFMAGRSVAITGLDFASIPYGGTIGCFAPVLDEFDPLALVLKLDADGFRLALPMWQGAEAPMPFHAWTPGDSLARTERATREPVSPGDVVVPHAILVPLLGFDREGRRFGRGGGAYCRTIAHLRAGRRKPTVIGIAFDEQQRSDDLEPGLWDDQRLDWVLTPSGAKPCRMASGART